MTSDLLIRRDGRPAPTLTITGYVEIDGDTVYVNGMVLANLLRAFAPPDTGDKHVRYERLAITVEDTRGC